MYKKRKNIQANKQKPLFILFFFAFFKLLDTNQNERWKCFHYIYNP